MPQHVTKTSYKPKRVRPLEEIEKQRETMRQQIAQGLRKPPRNPWTEETRRKYQTAATEGRLDRAPIGSRRIQQCGQVRYWVVKIGPGRKGWLYEHRHVMAQLLGRPLERSEHVHHKNGDTLDNRPENLELLSHSQHSEHHGQHHSNYKLRGVRKLAPKQWSLQHETCVICNRTDSKHAAKGVCARCYARRGRAAT